MIPSAYITSKSRVEQLSKDHLVMSGSSSLNIKETSRTVKKSNKNIITTLSDGDTLTNKNLNSRVKSSKNILNRSNPEVDTSKKAITVGRFESFSSALKNSEKLKEYDLLIKAPIITGSDFKLYAVNIEPEEFADVFGEISALYDGIEETSQTRINFIHKRFIKGDRFIKRVKKAVNTQNDDSGEYVLKLIDKLQKDKSDNFQIRYNKAKRLYNQGDYEKAVKAFDELYEEHNEHIAVNFYLARSYYKMGKYEQASAAFERITILDDTHQRARLELALTYMKLGLNDEAVKEFNIVLRDKNIPENVVKNIRQKIEQIKQKKKKHFFYGTIGFGVTLDTNPNNTTDSKTFDTPNVQGIKITDEIYNDIYYSVNLNANYLYKINDSLSLENKLNYLHQFYNKDDERLDDSTLSGIGEESKKELELASYNLYLTSYNKDSLLSGGIDLSKVRLGKDDYSQTYGLALSYQSKVFRNTKNLAILKCYKKEYLEEDAAGAKISENLDSNNIQLILGNNIPTDNYGIFSLLYSFLGEFRIDADKYGAGQSSSDKLTNTFIVNNRYPFNEKLSFGSTLMYSRVENQDPDNTFYVNKKDSLVNLSLEASYKLYKDMMFSADLKYINNNSNINIYSYDKQTYGLNFKYFF